MGEETSPHHLPFQPVDETNSVLPGYTRQQYLSVLTLATAKTSTKQARTHNMFKRLTDWLLPGSSNTATPDDPHIIPRDQHPISRKEISEAALKVIAGLRREGFEAFLVGGGVRDLLLGGHPKDFDVATDATPEQVKKVFRSARIIGRRFKIVHVRFGREVIEVTTFRGSHDEPERANQGKRPANQLSAKSESGMLLRDNVYGTVEQDAIRRDFTINALYYTTKDFAVYDYTSGLKDLKSKTIRIIGDAETRYREDPVRMLRAVRFAGKLGFSIEKSTAAPIKILANSLQDISSARMFDEILKLFMAGHAEATYQLLQQYQLFEPLFPEVQHALQHTPALEKLIIIALRNTDSRINAGKPVTPAYLFAALLWPPVKLRFEQLLSEGVPDVPAMHQAAQEVAGRQQQYTAVPKRFGFPMREIWDLQLRLPKRHGKRPHLMLENRRFRAAYDFLLLREQSGEETGQLGDWWTEFQLRSEDGRNKMIQALGNSGKGKRTRPRKRKANRPPA
jgi:poly(A) polymerase